MKPEHVLIVLSAQQEIRKQQQRLDTVMDEEAVLIPEVENLTPRDRLWRVYDAVLDMTIDPTPYEDSKYIDGTTPSLPVEVESDEGVTKLLLYLSAGRDESGPSIGATWLYAEDPPNSPRHEERIEGPGWINTSILADIEWSLMQYQAVLKKLSAEQMAEIGFRQEFIDQTATSRIEA